MDVRQYDCLGHPWSHRYRGAVGGCGKLWGAVGGCGGLWGAVGSCGELWGAVGSLLFQVSPSADVDTGYVVYCSQQGDGSCVV